MCSTPENRGAIRHSNGKGCLSQFSSVKEIGQSTELAHNKSFRVRLIVGSDFLTVLIPGLAKRKRPQQRRDGNIHRVHREIPPRTYPTLMSICVSADATIRTVSRTPKHPVS